MEPPRGGRGILPSARVPPPLGAMAHATAVTTSVSSVFHGPPDAKAARTEEPSSSADHDVVRQLVQQLGDSMAASLRQVAAQYGVADALAAPPPDARAVAQELQRARRKAAELQLLVDDLQTEQRVARERLALYSILALKLKRELINEKLAHIDSKKEVDEIRQQYETAGGASSVGARSPEQPGARALRPQVSDQRRGSYESLRGGAHSAEEDDPWSSPNKPASDAAFGSFYSSRQQTGGRVAGSTDQSQRESAAAAGEEDDEEDDDERMMDMQPLRNSLIGQFLPSTLLDSPQLTPKARSVASGPRSLENQAGSGVGTQPDEDDHDEDDEPKFGGDADQSDAASTKSAVDAAHAELERELAPFALEASTKVGSCDACGRARAPVVELLDCGHRLCRPCDRVVSSSVDDSAEQRPPQCPRCFKSIRAVRRLEAADNQVDHLRIETSRPSSSDSTATAVSHTTATTTAVTTATSTGNSATIAPLTLSLLSEMFENIPLDELEQFLKDAGGQVSGAIERILQRHPAFNPALAAEVSVTAGPGAGSGTQKGGHSTGGSHRTGPSGSAGHSQQQNQQQPQQGGASGNWKTEMCMYYLQGKCNKTRRTCSFAHGESDLVRTTTPKHTSSTSYKSRMCPLWLEGSCPKSRRECPLAHGENDLRDGLALLGQNAGGAAGAGGAPGAIQAPTLPTTAPRLQNYKTELCYYYLKGCCNFTKEECRFAHGESDLRTVESNTLEWSAQLGVASAVGAMVTDKSALQHQFQQQYQQQQQSQQPQQFMPPYQSQSQQSQQPQQQPAMAQHPPYGLTPLPAPFVPQAHQYHQVMHPHQLQAPVPPALQQVQYAQHQPPYRYMKSMDDAKPPRRPAPPRRESTWSQPSYDSLGPDF